MRKKKIEYKPILVLYINEQDFNRVMQDIPGLTEKIEYFVIVIPTSGDPKAEIISVDKATVVEDIQKYIDLKQEVVTETVIPSVPKEQRLIS